VNITTIREKYPQYNDLSDKQLLEALHDKYYSDIPIEQFYKKIGLTQVQPLQNKPTIKPKVNTEKTNVTTQIEVNPKINSTKQSQADNTIYFWLVIVGLIISYLFKKYITKKSELNKKQANLEAEFNRSKSFEELVKSQAECIKNNAIKQAVLELELNQARTEIEKRARIESERIKADKTKQTLLETELNKSRSLEKQARSEVERIKADAIKQAVLELELELNQVRSELERRVRIESERIMADEKKQSFLEAELNKSRSFEKQAKSEVESIKADVIKKTVLEAEIKQSNSFDRQNVTPISTRSQFTEDVTKSTVIIIKDENTDKFEDMF
jgi:hypothetical protein